MRMKLKNKKIGAKIFAFLTSLALLANEGAGLIINATPSQEDLNAYGKVYKLVSSSVTDETDATYAPNYKNGSIQYNPNDPLGVATRFHLFTDGTVKNNIHTNGNMATAKLIQGANSGTQGFQGEVTYIRSFENYSNKVFGDAAGSVPGTFVVGAGNDVTMTDGGNYFAINGTKVNDMLNSMYQDTETDKFIDLETEMDAYKNLSKKLPTATGARSYADAVTTEGAKRIFALSMTSGCDVINIGADDATDFFSASEIILAEYELGTADYANKSVVINVDLSKCSSTINVPKIMLRCKGKDTTESHGHRTTFEYGNVLWNFYDSSTANGVYTGTINTNLFWGTILAPGADVVIGQNIDGNIIAHNITINNESHRNDFRGLLPTSFVADSTPKGSIVVTVTEEESNKAIEGILVTVKGDNYTKEIKTDKDGKVEVANLPAGDYTVSIPKENSGYVTLTGTSNTSTKNVVAGNTPTEYEFQLKKEPLGTVIIKVKEESSSNIVTGAKVEIKDKNGNTKTGTTGADGTVTFTDVPVGECDTKITEVPEGYYVTSETEKKVTVPSGNSVTATYEVAKKGAIEINVIEKVSKDKVTAVEVTITGPNGYNHKETTGTDGQVSVQNLTPGEYTVTIPAENAGYEKLTGGSNTTKVDVPVGNTGKYTFELVEAEIPAETGTVIIKVKEENSSNVVTGAKVEIKDKNGNTKTGTTKADGTVTFTDVPVGECDTKITEVPEGYYVTSETEKKVTVPSGNSVTATYEVAKKGAIEINVIEKVSKDKVTAVEVTITGPNGYNHKETTGTDGQVSVQNLTPGEYTVTIPAENAGYEKLTGGSNTTKVDVPVGNTGKYTFELVEAETPDEEKGNLTIKVTDEKEPGKPVPGATVVVTYPDGKEETKTTNKDGIIELPDVPTGSYTTEIKEVPDGYTVTTDEEKTVVVNKGDDKTVEYKVDKAGSLKVIVKEKNSTTKVGNVTVKVTGTNYSKEFTTNTTSDILVEDLPIGNYTVTISKDNAGYVTLTASQAQKADAVKENATTEYVFELEKEPDAKGNLTIKVTDEETGKPVPGATVVVTYPNGKKETHKTDKNGEISLPNVPTGNYTTEITEVPDGYTVTTDEEKKVTVNKDDDKTIEYKVDKAGSLKVIVKEKNSTTKVGNVTVKVTGTNYSKEFTTNTTSDILVEDLPIGNYTVTISKDNAGYVTLTASQAQKADAVKENATTEYVFELEKEPDAKGNLTIKVTDEETGKPVPGATVVVTHPNGKEETKTTDENGEIKLPNVPAGSYTTEVKDVPDGYTVTTDDKKTVVVNKGEDKSIEHKVDKPVPQPGKGNLTITVTDEKTGAAVPGATVKVTDPSGKTTEYTTDANGQIKLTNVPAGKYTTEITKVPAGYTVTTNTKTAATVEVNKTAQAEYKVGKTASTTDTPTNDPTDDPEDSDEDEDEDDKLGSLIITVEDEVTGDPVPNATVKVTYPNGKSKTYKSNEDGEIELEDVPAGNYQIEVTDVPDGYTVTLNKKSTAKVKKGDTAEKLIKVKTSDANTNTNTNTTNGTSVKPNPKPSTPAKVTSSQPKTGDDMNPMFFLVLFLVSAFALILSILGLKRANRRERERQVTFRRQF